MKSPLSDLSHKFDEFMNSEEDLSTRISNGKILLEEIRAVGAYISDLVEREKYAQMARDISDVIFEIDGVLPPARLYALETTKLQEETEFYSKEESSLIQHINIKELRERSGKYGSRVNWIDRGVVNPSDLRAHGRIIITGRMKVGKTREAVELICRMVMDDQVAENRIFEPSPIFRFFNKQKLQEMLRDIDLRLPILLFLDDFPRHYTGETLERLSDLLQALKSCKSVLVVATARNDQMTDEHLTWLGAHKFQEVKLPDLNVEQIGRLLDSATGVYGLQVDDQARAVFLEKQDGTPELTLIGLRKLHLQGVWQVTSEIAQHVTSESIVEAWADARRYVIESHPSAEYLINAMATFYAADVHSYTYLILEYAKHLWRSQKSWGGIERKSALQRTLGYLSNFDIVDRKGEIFAPDVVVENEISKDEALNRLGDFLLRLHSLYRIPSLRWLYPYAELHAWALFDLGNGFHQKKSHLSAKRCYSASLDFHTHFIVYNNRGLTYHNLLDYPAALADYSKAIELNPQYANAYYNRGNTYDELQDYPAALADFAKAIELDPRYATAYNNRGLTYYKLHDYPAALADYSKAIELDSQFAPAYSNRGLTYHNLHDYPAALADYSKAIELDSQFAPAYSNRGNTYDELQNYPAALADYSKAIELNPQLANAYFNRGNTYYELQNYPAALADYSKAIELNPQYANAYNNCAITYANLQNYPAALASYSKAIELNPRDANAYYNAACIFALQSQAKFACDRLLQAIRIDAKYLDFITTDSDFDPIRDTSEFQTLLKEFKQQGDKPD